MDFHHLTLLLFSGNMVVYLIKMMAASDSAMLEIQINVWVHSLTLGLSLFCEDIKFYASLRDSYLPRSAMALSNKWTFIHPYLASSFVPIHHYFCTQIKGIDWAFIFIKFTTIEVYFLFESQIMWYICRISHLENNTMHLFYLQSEISGEIEQESIHYILTLLSAELYKCTSCPFQPNDDACHIYINYT